MAQLESELQSHQKTSSNPKLLSDILTLTTKIAELRQTLQEAEYQKQQITLERNAAVQEVEAKKKVEMQLHRHLGKVYGCEKQTNSLYTPMHTIQINHAVSSITYR